MMGFSLLHSFDLQPRLGPVGAVRRVGILGDDALPVQPGSMFKHLLPVADEVLGLDDRGFNSFEEVFQRGLAINLSRTAQVEAVQVQQVEGAEHQLVLSASSKFGLEF